MLKEHLQKEDTCLDNQHAKIQLRIIHCTLTEKTSTQHTVTWLKNTINVGRKFLSLPFQHNFDVPKLMSDYCKEDVSSEEPLQTCSAGEEVMVSTFSLFLFMF